MRQCFIFIFFTFSSFVVFGQAVKEMSPESGKYIERSPEGEKMFAQNSKRCKAVWEKVKNEDDYEKLSSADKMIYDNCPDGSDYWDIIGVECSWYCGGGPDSVKASSELKPQKDITYSVSNAHDLSYKTAWVEGVPGYGIGEYLTYCFAPESPRITKVIVINGYVKSEKAWKENSRVKKLKMFLNDKPFAILNLEDSRCEQIFTFPPIGNGDRKNLKSQASWSLKFEIMDVYKGSKYDDTAITEIYFDGLDVHCFAAGTQIMMADHTEKAIEQIQEGDSIVTFDTETNRILTTRVMQLIETQHSILAKLIFDNREVVVTDDHPFYVKDKQWTSLNPEKSNRSYIQEKTVSQLLVGDSVFVPMDNRFESLKSIEYQDDDQLTYTIEPASGNNFVANGMLVKTEVINQSPAGMLPEKQLSGENYQEVTNIRMETEIKPDKYAMYPNGLNGVLMHMAKEMRYPVNAQIRKKQGIVIVRFTVNVDGTVQDVKVVKSIDKELDAEAVRVMKSLKIWEPAYKNGKPVEIEYEFPVNFRLQ